MKNTNQDKIMPTAEIKKIAQNTLNGLKPQLRNKDY
jgi:hypothetical protein